MPEGSKIKVELVKLISGKLEIVIELELDKNTLRS